MPTVIEFHSTEQWLGHTCTLQKPCCPQRCATCCGVANKKRTASWHMVFTCTCSVAMHGPELHSRDSTYDIGSVHAYRRSHAHP